MTWTTNVLVIANVTASSDDLLAALRALSEREPARFTLIVPATAAGGGRQGATEVMQAALQRYHEAGLEADAQLGDGDPCVAATEAYDPKRHDQIIVSTLPLGSSKWLHAGLPERIAKVTGASVTHVVVHPRAPEPHIQPAPPRRKSLGPLLEPYAALGHSELPHRPLR